MQQLLSLPLAVFSFLSLYLCVEDIKLTVLAVAAIASSLWIGEVARRAGEELAGPLRAGLLARRLERDELGGLAADVQALELVGDEARDDVRHRVEPVHPVAG